MALLTWQTAAGLFGCCHLHRSNIEFYSSCSRFEYPEKCFMNVMQPINYNNDMKSNKKCVQE